MTDPAAACHRGVGPAAGKYTSPITLANRIFRLGEIKKLMISPRFALFHVAIRRALLQQSMAKKICQ
jgi:hypothetical protein